MDKVDSIDRAILEELQHDSSRSIQDIASAVGLSQNPCWRRIKQLETAGIILGRVALLDSDKVGVGVTVFVNIRTNRHEQGWLERFATGIIEIPEVVEVYRMSGDVDYLLKVLVSDIAHYDRIYKKLIEVAELNDVSSSFAMERIRYTTAIPLPDAA